VLVYLLGRMWLAVRQEELKRRGEEAQASSTLLKQLLTGQGADGKTDLSSVPGHPKTLQDQLRDLSALTYQTHKMVDKWLEAAKRLETVPGDLQKLVDKPRS
jgi:hypothetical protein